jgi:pimeloyl-ACP methyl ester carboxylesterase
MPDKDTAIETGRVTANGVDFGFLACGSGPLALCLHGFPDSAHTWRRLLPELATAGFRAVAPFMRGYAPTQVPADGRYQTGVLALDALALHEALAGNEQGVIVGHDWGAAATYAAVGHEPDRWARAVGLAVPPGQGLAQALLTYPQLRRSWYFFFFQHPLSDVVVPLEDLAFIDRLWADWSPGYEGRAEIACAKDALREPANLQAALGYYRAVLGNGYRDPSLEEIDARTSQPLTVPTLYLHGADDGCVGVEVASGLLESGVIPPGSEVAVVEGAGHFLHLERPEVNERIVEYLTR